MEIEDSIPFDVSKLIELDREIKRLGTGPDSFRPRWEFGRELLRLLPNCHCSAAMHAILKKAIGLSQNEIELRFRLAKRIGTEQELAEATAVEPHWTALIRRVSSRVRAKTKKREFPVPSYGRRGPDSRVVNAVLTLASTPGLKTEKEVLRVAHYWKTTQSFICQAAMLPWLTLIRTHEGFGFIVDEELRTLVNTYSRGVVGEFSLVEHLHRLRSEIVRVREANRCERQRRQWNSHDTHAAELISLLDYIENELDKIPSTTTTNKRLAQSKPMPSRSEGESPHEGKHHDCKEGSEGCRPHSGVM